MQRARRTGRHNLHVNGPSTPLHHPGHQAHTQARLHQGLHRLNLSRFIHHAQLNAGADQGIQHNLTESMPTFHYNERLPLQRLQSQLLPSCQAVARRQRNQQGLGKKGL